MSDRDEMVGNLIAWNRGAGNYTGRVIRTEMVGHRRVFVVKDVKGPKGGTVHGITRVAETSVVDWGTP